MDKKTTSELLNILNNADSKSKLDKYMSEANMNEFSCFADYFKSLDKYKARDKKDIIKKSQIEQHSANHILSGVTGLSRDKVLAFCIAAGLDLKETQRGLEVAKEALLYSRDRRDAVIIFSINKSLDVMQTNELLDEMKLPPINTYSPKN